MKVPNQIIQPEDGNITYIPHDFKVACVIHNIPISSLLQLFVNHVSFYDSFPGSEESEYQLATMTLLKYANEDDNRIERIKERGLSKKNSKESVELIKTIIEISRSEMPNKFGREICEPYVQKLQKLFGEKNTKRKTLFINGVDKIELTPDFCLICEIHNCVPIDHVINFMTQISMADLYARLMLGKEEFNPAMVFFYEVSEGYGNLNNGKRNPKLDLHSYVDDLQQLNLNLFIYRSLQYRTEKYKELFDRHYEEIINAN